MVRSHNFFEETSSKEKSIHTIEFSDKKADWESWSQKFFLHGEFKGCKKLLVSSGSMSGVDQIHMQ